MNRLLLFLAGIALLASASLAFRPAPLLTGRPFTEDGFYVLTIARHAAAGDGFTIDGSTPTNGFQPLYTMAIAAVALLTRADQIALVRAVHILEWTIYAITAAVLGSIAAGLVGAERRRSAFLATATVYLSLRFVLLQHFNGLETGLLLLVVAALWRCFVEHGVSGLAGAARFGALLGLAILTRLDAVFLVAAVLVLVWTTSEPRVRVHAAAITALVPALFLAPWLLYSYRVSGTLMPTSGLAQQLWAFDPGRWLSAGLAIAQAGIPIYLGAFEDWPVALGRAVLLIASAAAVYRPLRRAGTSNTRARRTVHFGLALVSAYLLLLVWYASSSWATHFYVRYSAPLVLASCLVAGLAISRLAQRHTAAAVLVTCLLVLQSVAYAAALNAGVYAGTRLPRVAPWSRPLFADQLRLVLANVPAEATVAAGQSGTLGYFRDGVLNVDGKVNAEALEYQDRMTEYLYDRGVYWFCDMRGYVSRYLGPRPEEHGWTLVAEAGLFRLYHRVSA